MNILIRFSSVNIDVMITRQIEDALTQSLNSYPITVLTGPRQSGKTTLLRKLSEYSYVSLENPDIRSFAMEDPRGFLETYNNKVIFDEVQQVPELFSYLQGLVDARNEMGQFILSGSQNFQLMASISQSLAGRADILRLFPFDMDELKSFHPLEDSLSNICTRGFYPAIYDRDIDPDKYYANYLTTYVNRDVTQLINIQDNSAFRRLLKICATRASQLVNYNDMARDVGVSHTTLRNWLSILETSYVIYFLPPYYKNYSKRLIKSPKLYFWDNGILTHLLGIRKGELDHTHQHWGMIFENLVVTEFHKKNAHQSLLIDYYFWRDSKGHEIDLLHLDHNGMNIHEIKASKTIKSEYLKELNHFEKISEESPLSKTLIYGGNVDQTRTNAEVKSWLSL